MRIVIQRVREASVDVDGATVTRIGPGLVALVGVGRGDEEPVARRLASKTAALRLFPGDPEDPGAPAFERSVGDVGGSVLCVSQFTLLGDVRRGNRPSWADAAPSPHAMPLVAAYAQGLREAGIPVAEGAFGAHMQVALVNDGPVTLVLDSRDLDKPRRSA